MDRCPTGSGVTARIAVQHAKSLIKLGDERIFENGITHSTFTGKVYFITLVFHQVFMVHVHN